MLPLYKALQEDGPVFKYFEETANAGLWFDRFFNAYEIVQPENELVVSEKKWLDSFVGTFGDSRILEKKVDQQSSLAVQTLKGCAAVYKSEWHFVTGMGLPHPVENGFLWHPTLGVPYLPGTAVKGIVRSYLEVWGNEDDNLKEQLLKWFGSDDKDPLNQEYKTQAGCIIFFDALPISSVKLGVDIMTPHMGDWYAKGNQITNVQNDYHKIMPADWHDPVPIKYLVVKEAQFLFSIAPRKQKDSAEVEQVMALLDSALQWVGAGAKTAVGYGLFCKNEAAFDKIKNKLEETELNSLPSHERIPKEVERMGIAKLPVLLGRNRNKTLTAWGTEQDIYLQSIKQIFGEQIKNWENSEKTNEQKVFRLIFPD